MREGELIQRSCDCSALGVAENYNERRPESIGRELHAPDLRRRDDVTCHPDDEKVAESLVKNDLGGNAGIRAAEDDCERLLVFRNGVAAALAGEGVATANPLAEALVSFPQALKSFRRG